MVAIGITPPNSRFRELVVSDTEDSKREARRGLTVFVLTLFASTLAAYFLDLYRPRVYWHWWPFTRWVVLSSVPGIAAILTRTILREGFRDLSFRLRGEWVGKAMVVGWLAPLASGLVTYGLVWASGAARFRQGWHWGPERLVGISIATMVPLRGFLVRMAVCLLYSWFLCLQSAGQEIGWRGYMLTRLYDAKVSVPIFWNGLFAALWWLPFMLHDRRTPEPEPFAVSFFFFVAGTIASSYLIGYLRLRSGSIWPAVICSASVNSVLGVGFASFLDANEFVRGEVYLLNFAVWVLALLFVKRPWPLRYFPESDARHI